MGETDEYRYSFHVYDGLKVSYGHILGFYLEATKCFRGCSGIPTPLPVGCAISPWAYSYGSGDILFLFGRTISPGT